MIIRPARKSDLSQINDLLKAHNFTVEVKDALNHRDISIVADSGGKIVGFMWAGLMAKNTIAYVDLFTVHPEYRKSGVGHKLALKTFEEAKKRGAKKYFGFIRLDESHDASAVNALKLASKTDGHSYRHIYGTMENTTKELGV